MMPNDQVFAGIELGGTKCIAVLASGGELIETQAHPTEAPSATLSATLDVLARWRTMHDVAAIGIASFGPLGVQPGSPNYGRVLQTPKPGWSGFDLLGAVQAQTDLPIGFDTDVAGAALAEQRWGGSAECRVHAYVTIGTGVGAGIVVDGRPVHGFLHPEIGHMRVPRLAGDDFVGSCPFHGDCIEGLVSGPALAARCGMPGAEIPDDHPIWRNVAHELGDFFVNMLVSFAPERIALGGGVFQQRPFLIDAVRQVTAVRLGGYLPDDVVAPEQRLQPATLGANAGPLGAIALAAMALAHA